MLRVLLWLIRWLTREASWPSSFSRSRSLVALGCCSPSSAASSLAGSFAMPDDRDLEQIDADLTGLAALNRDANCQLASVRRQITELESHEVNLIAAVDARMRRADRLLDERNNAAIADALVRH